MVGPMSGSRIGAQVIVGGTAGGSADKIQQVVAIPHETVTATVEQVQEPTTLVRLLNDIQRASAKATLASRAAPDVGANILGPSVASGHVWDVTHRLGRVPVSVTCVRAIGAAWTGYEISSSAIDSTKQVRLQMPASGTFYFRVG